MKKTILTIAIVLGMTVLSFGQAYETGGGMFKQGSTDPRNLDSYNRSFLNGNSRSFTSTSQLPSVPANDQTTDNSDVPLGDGLLLLGLLGGAYLLGKRRK